MKDRARRKLTLLDAMILVAAAAAGIAAARVHFVGAATPSSLLSLELAIRSIEQTQVMAEFVGSSTPSSAAANRQQIALYERQIALTKLFSSYAVFLLVWTLVLVLLGLRQPRPRLRRLVQEPGWAACLTVIVVLVVRTLSAVLLWGTGRWLSLEGACVSVLEDLAEYSGPAIVAVWLVIALGRRGRLEWSAIGWLTMITAVAWVILVFDGAAITALAPL